MLTNLCNADNFLRQYNMFLEKPHGLMLVYHRFRLVEHRSFGMSVGDDETRSIRRNVVSAVI